MGAAKDRYPKERIEMARSLMVEEMDDFIIQLGFALKFLGTKICWLLWGFA
jgi:hypothetical protein